MTHQTLLDPLLVVEAAFIPFAKMRQTRHVLVFSTHKLTIFIGLICVYITAWITEKATSVQRCAIRRALR